MVFEIIPVIDIMQGKAVSGIGGRRERYRELKSVYCDSSNPVELVKKLPFKKVYIADLDAIMHRNPNIRILENISKIHKEIWVDLGIRDYKDIHRYSELDIKLVIGTETLQSIDNICLKEHILSLDIKDGKLLSPFLPKNPFKAFEFMASMGARKFIILNITRVGTLKGCDINIREFIKPNIEIYVGGGIRKKDIEKLKKIGVKGALVGTALHRGEFT